MDEERIEKALTILENSLEGLEPGSKEFSAAIADMERLMSLKSKLESAEFEIEKSQCEIEMKQSRDEAEAKSKKADFILECLKLATYSSLTVSSLYAEEMKDKIFRPSKSSQIIGKPKIW